MFAARSNTTVAQGCLLAVVSWSIFIFRQLSKYMDDAPAGAFPVGDEDALVLRVRSRVRVADAEQEGRGPAERSGDRPDKGDRTARADDCRPPSVSLLDRRHSSLECGPVCICPPP